MTTFNPNPTISGYKISTLNNKSSFRFLSCGFYQNINNSLTTQMKICFNSVNLISRYFSSEYICFVIIIQTNTVHRFSVLRFRTNLSSNIVDLLSLPTGKSMYSLSSDTIINNNIQFIYVGMISSKDLDTKGITLELFVYSINSNDEFVLNENFIVLDNSNSINYTKSSTLNANSAVSLIRIVGNFIFIGVSYPDLLIVLLKDTTNNNYSIKSIDFGYYNSQIQNKSLFLLNGLGFKENSLNGKIDSYVSLIDLNSNISNNINHILLKNQFSLNNSDCLIFKNIANSAIFCSLFCLNNQIYNNFTCEYCSEGFYSKDNICSSNCNDNNFKHKSSVCIDSTFNKNLASKSRLEKNKGNLILSMNSATKICSSSEIYYNSNCQNCDKFYIQDYVCQINCNVGFMNDCSGKCLAGFNFTNPFNNECKFCPYKFKFSLLNRECISNNETDFCNTDQSILLSDTFANDTKICSCNNLNLDYLVVNEQGLNQCSNSYPTKINNSCPEHTSLGEMLINGVNVKVCLPCTYLSENNLLIENGKCVENCSKSKGYVNNSFKVCKYCKEYNINQNYALNNQCLALCPSNYEQKLYVNNDYCSLVECDPGYVIINNKCVQCDGNENDLYSIQCVKICPNNTVQFQINGLNYCGCLFGYLEENKCVSKCSPGFVLRNNVCRTCSNSEFEFEKECHLDCPVYTVKISEKSSFSYKNYCRKCFNLSKQGNTCVFDCKTGLIKSTKIYENINYFECVTCLELNINYPSFYDNQCYDICPVKTFNNSNICNDCKTRYFANSNCVDECPSNTFPDLNGICHQIKNCNSFQMKSDCIDNCEFIKTSYIEYMNKYFSSQEIIHNKVGFMSSIDFSICLKCETSNINKFYFFEDSCVNICPNQTVLNTSNNKCFYCENNKVISNNSCKEKCEEEKYLNVNTNKCEVCNNLILDNKCVNFCPDKHLIIGKKCTECKFMIERYSISNINNENFIFTNGEYSCVKQCSESEYINNNECIICDKTSFWNLHTLSCEKKCLSGEIEIDKICHNCDKFGMLYYQGQCISNNQCKNTVYKEVCLDEVINYKDGDQNTILELEKIYEKSKCKNYCQNQSKCKFIKNGDQICECTDEFIGNRCQLLKTEISSIKDFIQTYLPEIIKEIRNNKSDYSDNEKFFTISKYLRQLKDEKNLIESTKDIFNDFLKNILDIINNKDYKDYKSNIQDFYFFDELVKTAREIGFQFKNSEINKILNVLTFKMDMKEMIKDRLLESILKNNNSSNVALFKGQSINSMINLNQNSIERGNLPFLNITECENLLRSNNKIQDSQNIVSISNIVEFDALLNNRKSATISNNFYTHDIINNQFEENQNICEDYGFSIFFPISEKSLNQLNNSNSNTTILQIKEQNPQLMDELIQEIDLFDSNNIFFENICIKYSNEKVDFTLNMRRRKFNLHMFCSTCNYMNNFRENVNTEVECKCLLGNEVSVNLVQTFLLPQETIDDYRAMRYLNDSSSLVIEKLDNLTKLITGNDDAKFEEFDFMEQDGLINMNSSFYISSNLLLIKCIKSVFSSSSFLISLGNITIIIFISFFIFWNLYYTFYVKKSFIDENLESIREFDLKEYEKDNINKIINLGLRKCKSFEVIKSKNSIFRIFEEETFQISDFRKKYSKNTTDKIHVELSCKSSFLEIIEEEKDGNFDNLIVYSKIPFTKEKNVVNRDFPLLFKVNDINSTPYPKINSSNTKLNSFSSKSTKAESVESKKRNRSTTRTKSLDLGSESSIYYKNILKQEVVNIKEENKTSKFNVTKTINDSSFSNLKELNGKSSRHSELQIIENKEKSNKENEDGNEDGNNR
jgi:hypothetical protein